MALDFNMLRPTSGPNPVSSFFQGQQAAQDRQAAQQDAVQRREFDALRKQQIVSQMQAAEQTQNRELVTQRTQQYRDRLLRAGTPDAVRNLIRQRHADPVLGRAMQQFGSLDEDLAEVPDDVTAFQDYLSREAMGVAEFIKFTREGRDIAQIMGGGGGAAAPAAAPSPAAPAAPSQMNLPAGVQLPGDFASTQAMGRVPGVVTTPILPSPPPMNAMMPAPINALAPTPPAPTNALATPVAALRAKRDQLIALGTPRAIQAAKSMDADIALLSKTTTASPGSVVVGADGKVIFTAPPAPLTPQIKEIGVAIGSNSPVYFDERTGEQFTSGRDAAGKPTRLQYTGGVNRSTSSVNMPKQESAFETGLGKGQSDRILANQVAAQDASEILRTNQVGRDLLTSGAITGTGADFLVGLNNGLKQVGIDFGFADAAANSQAYVAALGSNVGRIIKQFGAGTGLSDADREYAEKIAGGKIALTETALRKILDINDRASNRVIDLHNKNVAGIKTNIPLTVEKPTFGRSPAAASQIPTGAAPARAAPANVITNPQFPGFSTPRTP